MIQEAAKPGQNGLILVTSVLGKKENGQRSSERKAGKQSTEARQETKGETGENEEKVNCNSKFGW